MIPMWVVAGDKEGDGKVAEHLWRRWARNEIESRN